MSASLPMDSGAEIDARLNAMAAQPHRSDPRTRNQRRADALIALSRGQQHLACHCDDCTHEFMPDDETDRAAETSEPTEQSEGDSPAPDPTDKPHAADAAQCTCDTSTRPTFHIVANLTTLLGLDNNPGFLDGHGIIDADTMRTLLDQAHREFIRPTPPAPDATGYRPSRKLQALIRAGELCCTFPGCSAPAWSADLDHTTPFNHGHPRRGGSTTRSNLKPLCRFHHRIKTFTAWRDHQDEMGTVFFQSPTGHMYLGNAYTGTDLFTALEDTTRGSPPTTEHPARQHLNALRKRQRDAHQDLIDDARDEPPPF